MSLPGSCVRTQPPGRPLRRRRPQPPSARRSGAPGPNLRACREERELALQAPDQVESEPAPSRPRLRWWREALTIAAFYELYSLARNTQGSGSTTPSHAFRNARVIIHLEQALGLYREGAIQRLFLHVRPLVTGLDVYYGTAHFLVTGGVLIWLFLRHPDRYARWRWALVGTTLVALLGFLAFPVMPPRLITPTFKMGSYVDTLHTIGGLWNFEDGAIARLSNQYAAMPSLHFAWSLWCCLALWPRLRSVRARALAIAHPTITLVAVVATANHYWLDAAGGAGALAVGWLVGVAAAQGVDSVASRRRGGAFGYADGPGPGRLLAEREPRSKGNGVQPGEPVGDADAETCAAPRCGGDGP